MNTASRMESTGVPGRVQVSKPVATLLPDVSWEWRYCFDTLIMPCHAHHAPGLVMPWYPSETCWLSSLPKCSDTRVMIEVDPEKFSSVGFSTRRPCLIDSN
jgi:hypothetical protein